MLQIGKYNDLEVVKEVDFGLYLDGGPYGEILLPLKQIPEGTVVGEEISVFIYSDSEDRLIATTIHPKAVCDEFAFLEVKEVNNYGAFLDWGLSGKDLFVPFGEQFEPMRVGQSYLVMPYVDEKTDRVVATSKLNSYLKHQNEHFSPNDTIEIVIAQEKPEAYRVIIHEEFWGMLYKNEIFQSVDIGDRLSAFVKQIREDGRIDVSLKRQGYRQQIPDASQQILALLDDNNGFLPITDKSAPEKIYSYLQMSKKSFKKAVGALYKQRLVQLEKNGIRKVEN